MTTITSTTLAVLALLFLLAVFIVIEKLTLLRSLNRDASSFEKSFWSGGSLEALFERYSRDRLAGPFAFVFVSGFREFKRSMDDGALIGSQHATTMDRIGKTTTVAMRRELQKVKRGVDYLGAIRSVALHLGLLGATCTILASHSDALLSAGTGLAAAIPALALQPRNAAISRYGERLEFFANELLVFLSRQIGNASS